MDLSDAEFVWLVTCWFFEAPCFHCKWNDSEWNRKTWALNAASSIELSVNVQSVVVCDHVWMSCWWKVRKLEHLFLWSWHVHFLCWWLEESSIVILNHSLLSWANNILDLWEIKTHLLDDWFRMTWSNSAVILILKHIKVFCMIVPSVMNAQSLTNLEFSFTDFKLTFSVGDNDVCTSPFIVVEDVLVEPGLQRWMTFANAAAWVQFLPLDLFVTHLEFNWRLVNQDELLVLKYLSAVCMKNGLNRVSDLYLWTGEHMLVVEQDGSWSACRKIELEWNCEISWVQMLLKIESTTFEVEYLFRGLGLSGFLSIPILMMVLETGFLLALDFDLKPFGINFLIGSDVNLTEDGLSWIVESRIGLHIHETTFNLGSAVNVSHIFFYFNLYLIRFDWFYLSKIELKNLLLI